MKRLVTLLALSLVMIACNKEEENEQLTGWDKIVAEVGQTNKSAIEVLKSLTDDEVWVIENYSSFFVDDDKNIVEEDYSGETYYGGGGANKYRIADDETMLLYHHDFGTKLGELYYYETLGLEILSKDCLKLTYSYYPREEDIFHIDIWKVLAYDENQIVIELTYEKVPIYLGEPDPEYDNFLYSKIRLVRQIPADKRCPKDAITEKEYYDALKE
ncbi:MAG: hypothetical protein IKY82_01305 [Alistipes sp.]|nr:hypothetical protein [Alistipes sp.]